ncbi:BRISC and BRCA1-A complex member 2-like isoform X2 [Macrosteles quadrilineatus]|uniref:BRISC and BRCA1-A complex member 2-like isoform X2 n=1 Tax=Macrosteles quadrilineatus TaxID=74068 RepID=UPI0023E0EFBD|nr:BRISC and BRCA1-A complex member 2-like isoform X2 [Macrosteles quadrilineatus]
MITSVCLPLQRLLQDVLSSKLGICAREIELLEVSSGKPALEKLKVAINDRFKLKIPIADQYVIWQIIFNGAFPKCPPDFDLGDFDFYSINLEMLEDALPSLKNWEYTDRALAKVLTELHSAYLKYQVDKLETVDNRCAYEYSSLIGEGKVMPDQVEVFADGDAVHFLIKLDVDLTIILPNQDPEEYVLLAVRFGAHSSVRSANIIVSPTVQRLIGTVLDLPHNITGDEILFEYVDEVARSVENQLLTVSLQRKDKRKRYIFELLSRLGQSVVGYDALEYQSAAFLLEKNGYVCVMEVTLPSMFPRVCPSYRLLSAYTSSSEILPLSQTISLPYNDKWDVADMVDNALTTIKNKKISDFQKFTVPLFKLK